MKIEAPTTSPTEDTMSAIPKPRYGYQPTAAFAATRACADQRREQIVAATANPAPHGSLFHKLTALVLRSA